MPVPEDGAGSLTCGAPARNSPVLPTHCPRAHCVCRRARPHPRRDPTPAARALGQHAACASVVARGKNCTRVDARWRQLKRDGCAEAESCQREVQPQAQPQPASAEVHATDTSTAAAGASPRNDTLAPASRGARRFGAHHSSLRCCCRSRLHRSKLHGRPTCS